jgi:hypothetical protein
MLPRKAQPLEWAVGLVLFLAGYLRWVDNHMLDFEVDNVAATRIRAGEDPYQPEDGHFMYKYAPAAAKLEMPLALLPLPAAKFTF